MANRNAAKGVRFEHRVKADLEARGYFVMRSPASKSPIDLLAVNEDDVLFVQCKTDGRLDPGEWNILFRLAISKGGIPILASKPVRGGLSYFRMIDEKVEGGRTMWAPMEPWGTEIATAAALLTEVRGDEAAA